MISHSSDESLVARLLELPEAEQAELLKKACAANVGPAGVMSTEEMVRVFQTVSCETDAEQPGTQIGHYKLLPKIGEGGFAGCVNGGGDLTARMWIPSCAI